MKYKCQNEDGTCRSLCQWYFKLKDDDERLECPEIADEKKIEERAKKKFQALVSLAPLLLEEEEGKEEEEKKGR